MEGKISAHAYTVSGWGFGLTFSIGGDELLMLSGQFFNVCFYVELTKTGD